MPKFDPLFGKVAFEKAAKFIAIFDLVLVCIYVCSMFGVGTVVYEDSSDKYETDLSKAVTKAGDHDIVLDRLSAPSTTSTTTTTERTSNSSDSSDSDPRSHSHPPIFVLSLDDFHKLRQESLPSNDFLVFIAFCILAIGFAHIGIEIYFCRLLLKAASHKDGSALKRWFWGKLALTLMFVVYGILGISTLKMDIVDWIFEFMNIYRVYALYVIYEFKSHISDCVHVVKPRENV